MISLDISAVFNYCQTIYFSLHDCRQVAVVPPAPPLAWSAGANCWPRPVPATSILVLDVNTTVQFSTKYPLSPALLLSRVFYTTLVVFLVKRHRPLAMTWLLGEWRIGCSGMGTIYSGGDPILGQSTPTKDYNKGLLGLRGVDIKFSV